MSPPTPASHDTSPPGEGSANRPHLSHVFGKPDARGNLGPEAKERERETLFLADVYFGVSASFCVFMGVC